MQQDRKKIYVDIIHVFLLGGSTIHRIISVDDKLNFTNTQVRVRGKQKWTGTGISYLSIVHLQSH